MPGRSPRPHVVCEVTEEDEPSEKEKDMVNRLLIRAAGEYLLTVLWEEDHPVPFSRFYSADLNTADPVVEGIWSHYVALKERYPDEFSRGEKKESLKDAHRYIEWAAKQLEDIRVVSMAASEGALLDGSEDFLIGLTERGKEFVEDGETFGYRRPDTQVNVLSASECLINFLQDAGHPKRTVTEARPSDLESLEEPVDQSPPTLQKAKLCGLDRWLVSDDCDNVYEYASNTHLWAFLACLWHHVKSGVIAPEFETDSQRAEWEDFFRTNEKLFGRSVAVNLREIWHVPLRLTQKALDDPGAIDHLEWIREE